MHATINCGGWIGRTGLGLAPRELEATAWSASELTAKEVARRMGIAPGTVEKRLDDAKFKLGVRSVARARPRSLPPRNHLAGRLRARLPRRRSPADR